MIWLIGNKGMLGTDVETALKEANTDYIASDKEVDITNLDSIRSFIAETEISWIINCSAYTAVDKAEDEEELANQVNGEGVKNIALVAKEKGAVLIHISTDYVFSGDKTGPYIEDDETAPKGAYGRTKLAGEKYIQEILTDYFIIRISWFFGIHGNNFVYTMLRLFKERNEIRVVNDQWGSPTYSRDVSKFILEIIWSNNSNYGIYHYTNEGRTNWYEFAIEIYNQARQKGIIDKEVVITPISTEEYPTRAMRPKNSYLSKDRIKNVMGIAIQSWQDALKDFLTGIT